MSSEDGRHFTRQNKTWFLPSTADVILAITPKLNNPRAFHAYQGLSCV